jgi:hypothetical protein
VAVIFGDVWRILSPWKALADLVAFLSRSGGLQWRVFEYPERAGIWPAAVLLLCVLAVALAYLTAIGVARLLVSAARPLAPLFVYSLVPIALAHAIAHYFSLAYYPGGNGPFGSRATRSGVGGTSSGRRTARRKRTRSLRTRSGTSRSPRSSAGT